MSKAINLLSTKLLGQHGHVLPLAFFSVRREYNMIIERVQRFCLSLNWLFGSNFDMKDSS